jgi:hypothetical protein
MMLGYKLVYVVVVAVLDARVDAAGPRRPQAVADPALPECSAFPLQIAGFLRVGLPGLEPGTSSLSEKRSNRLSYRP